MNEETLFAEALGKQGAERAAFLDEHCQDDVELCKRLEGLLRAHDHPDPFLDAAAPVVTVDEPLRETAGTVIGPYKLIELIGEGGMGAVWMAQQTEPVKRLVAVKLIKAGMDSKQVISRFEAERQALALMDHPNIAKVLDAGQAPPAYAGGSPRPYFVMELVKGVPITKYCDEHHLTPRQRLEVFIPVCQAVQHAHQKGIIHRDIKPSNVLVTMYDGKPVAKVIDFGVAKAAGQQLTDKTLVTGFGAIVGTLEYMSPEQAEISQLDIDTRSDIYSLGVLLYELLTGSPPFNRKALEKAGMLEMLRVIREQEPSKPSTKLSTADGLPALAANRGTEPAKLTKLVRGELDWIVMKALEKDRNRRYETANGFALDVQRYLADEPVLACPPSALYRVRKFARRNKAALAMASSIFVAVAVVAIGLGWIAGNRAAQRAKAAESFEVALQKAVELLMDGDAPRARAATERAAGLLAGAGADELLQRRLQQIEADLDMVATLELVRLQQASGKEESFDTLIGARAYADAFRDYDFAVLELEPTEAATRIAGSAIREQLLAALVDWGNISTNSSDRGKLAVVLRLADTDPWRQQVFGALANKDWPRLAHMAGQPDALGQSAVRLEALGRILAMTDIPAAVEFFRQAQRRHPDDFWINHYLGTYLAQLKPARLEEAIGYFRVAVALRPQSPGAHLNLGHYLGSHGRWAEAEAEAREAIRLQKDFALAHNNLGIALREQGEVDKSIAECREAVRIQRNYALAHVNLGLGCLPSRNVCLFSGLIR